MSKHELIEAEFHATPHPNADQLELVQVRGWQCCVRKGEFSEGQPIIYIPPDYVVDSTRRGFEFLKGKERIKVRRLRGVLSYGLVVADDPARNGQDPLEFFGVTRYEPPLSTTMGEAEKGPDLPVPIYDVENYQNWPDVFEDGESLLVTEKIHGTNARFVWHDGRMWCGSRKTWKRENPDVLYWKILQREPSIEAFCKANPDVVLFGEIYGMQNLKYGVSGGRYRFAAFDMWKNGNWATGQAVMAGAKNAGIPTVPQLATIDAYHKPAWLDGFPWFGGPSELDPGTIKEGVVVRPRYEDRTHPELGRVILKIINPAYLEM